VACGRRGAGGQPGRVAGAAEFPVPHDCVQVPDVQPGARRPLHGRLPAAYRLHGRAIYWRVFQPRHRLAAGCVVTSD